MTDEDTCRTCGKPLAEGTRGKYCARCLFGTAMAELAEAPEAEAPPWEAMADLLPDYEFLGELGRGGMGTVYEAADPADGRRVAIKVLAPGCVTNPELVERFRREAEVMQGLEHEHIVRLRKWGERKGLLYLVMDFIPGGDLAKRLRDRGPLPLEEAVALLDQAAAGLEYSHGRGVLHRDLKPGNLLLDEEGRVKLGDFGLAKLLDAESDLSLTLTNASMGTPRYMAPEQLGEADRADERSDVYSLGVVFYEMLTGQVPEGNFALPSERAKVGERVDEWVLRALSDAPANRFASMSEARQALARLVRPRRTWRVALIATVVLALGVAGLLTWSSIRKPPAEELAATLWTIEAEGALPQGFPPKIDGALDVRVSAARRPFGVALIADGSLSGFGDDSYGQASPPAGRDFTAVALGRGPRAAHGLALRRDGTVAAWGDDSFGQARVPAGLSKVEAIQAGEFWSAARKRDGSVVVWGRVGDVVPEEIDWEVRETSELRAVPD